MGVATPSERFVIGPVASTRRGADDLADFSLVLGGPFHRLLRRLHLEGEALDLLRRRVVVLVALAWVPLLALSLFEGQALRGTAAVSFLLDVEANTRLLLALPLLIVAEVVVHRRMLRIVSQFSERALVAPVAVPRFHAAVASALRLRNSAVAELVLIALVYGVGVTLLWRPLVALTSTTTWYAHPIGGVTKLSLTGAWYAYVSLPLFQFVLVRWYYRILVWARLLFQMSRLDLNLIPTHPDRVGGLGFLTNVAYAFTPLAVAHGVMLAGPIANRIFHLNASLPQYKGEIFLVVLFVFCVVFGPFLVFAPRLMAMKRTGLREYGTLAERYVREFDEKWLRGGAAAGESFVGTADLQSLADLSNSFEVVKTARIVPITRDAVVPLIVAVLLPVLPLMLTMMSLEDLLKKLFGLLL